MIIGMNYYVYILRCADDSYYTGLTNDLARRMREHEQGEYPTSYTFERRPVRLVYHMKLNSYSDAVNTEKQIKGWRREKKEALIEGAFERLPELSKRYTSFDGG